MANNNGGGWFSKVFANIMKWIPWVIAAASAAAAYLHTHPLPK